MIHQKLKMPGIERIRTRFLEMLRDRQIAIAEYAIIAWESYELDEINGSLESARTLLHQIAGTAGSLGFEDLGHEARNVETEIDAHLSGADADLAICPGALIFHMDNFVQLCQSLIEVHPEVVHVP